MRFRPATVARFWSKVDVGPDDECCWTWKGAVGSNGYGRFRPQGLEPIHAHRVAWEISNGKRLGRHFACHHCDNRLCVNPFHIYAGDHASNTADAKARGRFTGNKKRDRFVEPENTTPERYLEIGNSIESTPLNGGRDRDRTCDPYDVNKRLPR